MYGPSGGAPMTESSPLNPTSTKSTVRAEMSEQLIDAHRSGRVEVTIGRAADFIGPGVTASAMGENVFGPALAARKPAPSVDPTPFTPTATSPTSAATSSC